MCGRYASFRETQDLADAFAIDAALVDDRARELAPSWNVAPTDDVRIVVERGRKQDDGTTGPVERSLRVARWGLVPSWAKDPSVGNRMINARAESLLDKPAFTKPFAARRCLVPAEGYYEWRVVEPGTPATAGRKATRPRKQPYWITPADGDVAALAGLYEFWRDPSRGADDPLRWLVSAAVVTRAASDDLAPIHDRMPLVLPRSAWDAWLDPTVGKDEAAALLDVAPETMVTRTVSPLVSSVRNNGPQLLDPTDPGEPPCATP
ncbi:SOS response-associated peptidase [Luteimicrobium subarcticum]|uniref:Abasic site processing protein n=1 Tax=Luteimicrobium subarcticum TaxID=620910 RepID=A0A2M8WUF0_9MICO|nr:SOS response-associated peptidase [Luteimicrobium subarcticum]PJI94560.1 putative SOS response-associated peptidase YedK [Luteimicrobium subarcticum]